MKIYILPFTMVLLFSSCKKSSNSPAPNPTPGNSGSVYAVGYESNGTVTVAKYWKDNVAVNLTDGTRNAQASGIYISGSDVYISGFEMNASGIQVAKYWKNGTEVVLSDGTRNELAYAIAVSGNNVFVLGDLYSADTKTVYTREWVNGTAYTGTGGIPSGVTLALSFNSAVTQSNGVFYLAGTTKTQTSAGLVESAITWSHTLPFALVAPTTITDNSVANSIAVSGSDVYVAGTVKGQLAPSYSTIAYYWKNKFPFPLTDGTRGAGALGICTSGTDVYVCGYEQTGPSSGSYPAIAKFWKNGTPISLGNGAISTIARSIAVSGNDVYTCGNDSYVVSNYTYNHAYLWKNGTVIDSTMNAGAMVAVAIAP